MQHAITAAEQQQPLVKHWFVVQRSRLQCSRHVLVSESKCLTLLLLLLLLLLCSWAHHSPAQVTRACGYPQASQETAAQHNQALAAGKAQALTCCQQQQQDVARVLHWGDGDEVAGMELLGQGSSNSSSSSSRTPCGCCIEVMGLQLASSPPCQGSSAAAA
jgi:hypothetical protein